MPKRKHDAEIGPLTIPAFHKSLDEISRSHRRYENFRSFMEAAYCALAKLTAPDAERADVLEARYMAIVRRHERDEDAMSRMAHLLARLELTIPDYKGDFLGEAYMQAEFGDEYRGQFFTPYAISSLIARMNVNRESVEATLAEGRPLTLCEPAAGAGCMVIAVADHLKELGFDLQRTLFATLIDVDALAYQMAYLQMSLKSIPAVCLHGDSLALKEFERAYTVAGALQQGLSVWPIGQSPPRAHAQPGRMQLATGDTSGHTGHAQTADGAVLVSTAAQLAARTQFPLGLAQSRDLSERGQVTPRNVSPRDPNLAQENEERDRARIAHSGSEHPTAPQVNGDLFPADPSLLQTRRHRGPRH